MPNHTPNFKMAKFEFEIVGTTNGLPDPLSYEPGLSRTRELDGAAKVVVEEFEDANIASSQACCHEEARCGKNIAHNNFNMATELVDWMFII